MNELVVHWDGKILPKIFGKGKVDRLPILVSGEGNDKVLSVPTWLQALGSRKLMQFTTN